MEKYDAEKQTVINDEFGQTGKLKFARPPVYKENPEVVRSIEVQRFKQDCRKRALDLAHGQLASVAYKMTQVSEKKEGQRTETLNVISLEHLVVTELADKYYNWLISIPE